MLLFNENGSSGHSIGHIILSLCPHFSQITTATPSPFLSKYYTRHNLPFKNFTDQLEVIDQ